MSCAAAAASNAPGFGLRQSQSSPESWKQVRNSSIGSASPSAALIASTVLPLRRSARDVRLVGHDDQQEARLAQRRKRLPDARQNLKFGDAGGRIGLAVAHEGAIEHPVAIEEHGASHGRTADSHLVWLAFSLGCETRRCQTTAWNASECGVTVSALTVGMMQQASAT